MDRVVGMGEYIVTNTEDDILRTFSLASCVAVTVYCPIKRAAGMIHVVLPYPFTEKDKKNRPSFFAETGVPLLVNEICRKYACGKGELCIELYGGADSVLKQDIYGIGKKNIDAVKKALHLMGLTVRKEDLRGTESRTISMDVKTGAVEISRQQILSCEKTG
jgi:chemotaxis protein CheD